MLRRDYQQEVIADFFNYFSSHPTGNPIAAMPTGTGKSHVIAGFLEDVYRWWPGQRIVKLTHSKKLIEQNADKLLKVWPTAPLGIYSAGLRRKEVAPITFAGIQSAARNPEGFGHVDLALVDECHLISASKETQYRRFFEAMLQINPNFRIMGLTATPFRLGLGTLTDGGVFTHFSSNLTSRDRFNQFISEGYLCRLIPKQTKNVLDVSGVRKQGGEFVAKALQEAVNKEAVTYYALEEVMNCASDRRSWMIFTAGIEHTESVVEMLLTYFGVEALPVHSKMTDAENEDAIHKLKTGQIRCVVNANMLTTGFDHPGVDLIVVLRPTNSSSLWVQMLGRGTRPDYAPGMPLDTAEQRLAAIANSAKPNCLVLDFASNTARLGPINDPLVPKKKGDKTKPGAAPVRLCDECGCYSHARAVVCEHCGVDFPVRANFGRDASGQALIAEDEEPQLEWVGVDQVTYAKHSKAGRPDTIRVTYFCGLRMYQEWLCFEHRGYPLHKAHDWWRGRQRQAPELPHPVPETVDEALTCIAALPTPSKVQVWINKKYPEVTSYDF